jgi:hypothetical protein
MELNDKPNDENLERMIKSRLELVLKQVCHGEPNTKHRYVYADGDNGLFIYLFPTGQENLMKMQILNLNDSTPEHPFDEFNLDITIRYN